MTDPFKTLTDELVLYIAQYQKKTGFKPPAIPITEKEKELLGMKFETMPVKKNKDKYTVDQFCGIDLYIHDNAEKIRQL